MAIETDKPVEGALAIGLLAILIIAALGAGLYFIGVAKKIPESPTVSQDDEVIDGATSICDPGQEPVAYLKKAKDALGEDAGYSVQPYHSVFIIGNQAKKIVYNLKSGVISVDPGTLLSFSDNSWWAIFRDKSGDSVDIGTVNNGKISIESRYLDENWVLYKEKKTADDGKYLGFNIRDLAILNGGVIKGIYVCRANDLPLNYVVDLSVSDISSNEPYQIPTIGNNKVTTVESSKLN